MAEQTSNVTLTLTDEMSEGLANIAKQFENLQRTITDTTRRANESFKDGGQEVNKYADSMKKIGEHMEALPKAIREPLEKVQQALGSIPQLLQIFQRTAGGATEGAGALGGAFSTLASRAGLAATAVIAVGDGIGRMLKNMTEANDKLQNLQMSLRANTNTTIVSVERLFESIGSSSETAIAQMQHFGEMYQELSKGNQAALAQTLLKHQGGKEVLDQFNKALREGKDSATAYADFLKWLGSQPTATQVELLKELNLAIAESVRAADRMRSEGLPETWGPSKEQVKEYTDNLDTIRLAYLKVADTVENVWNRIKFSTESWIASFGASVVLGIKTVMKDLEAIYNRDWGYLKQRFGEIARDPNAPASNDVLREEGQRRIEQNWREYMDRRHPPTIGGQRGLGSPSELPPTEHDWLRSYPGGVQPQSYHPGERGSMPFTLIGYSPDTEATGRGDVREIKDTNKQATTYLREITDIMIWLRQQIERAGLGSGPRVTAASYTTGGGGFRGGGGVAGAGAPIGQLPSMPTGQPPSFGGNAPLAPHGSSVGPGTGAGAGDTPAGSGGAAGAGGDLAGIRSKLTSDPEAVSRLMALTEAEVGNQGPEAKQAFMESVLNRAASRGQTLMQAVTDPGYYPGISLRREQAGISASQRAALGPIWQKVVGGSNISGFATGNASGRVGFGGGPQTFTSGGERFGVEARDRAWAARMRGAGATADAGSTAAPSDTGYSGLGGFNFMGSERARAMGINVQPGSEHDMVTRDTAAGRIKANKYAADDIAGFINDLHAAGAPLKNFSGVYNPRQKRGGRGWSQHAYGNALDIETGFGHGPENSPYLYAWAQQHPKEFAEIQAQHHMRNLSSFDWGHFEWSPAGKGQPDARAVDRAIGGSGGGNSPIGTAHVHVSFDNLPRGARTRGRADGVFKRLRIQHTPAMNTTGMHGPDDSNSYATEV